MFQLESKARFWILVFVLSVAVLWMLKPVLLPFAAGLAIAYFLDPVVDKIERRGVPRWLGALCVLAGFLLIIGLLALLILPLLQDQIGALVNAVPGYVEKARTSLLPRFEGWLARFSPEDVEKIRGAAGQYAGNAVGFVGKALQQIITSGIALIDVLALSIITPVVAFYLLRDWRALTTAFDSLLPRRHYTVISGQLSEINRTLAGFVRGQALVCVFLGFIYGIGLTLVGLQYGAAIGVAAGVLTFMPYIGTVFAWVVSIILALVQFDSFTRISMVIGVLLIGHWMEVYVLAPRLVGHRVGLHPVWILFALIAGARLMGFVGVLIAVPVAAVIGVLTRFAVQRYKQSSVYEDPTAPKQL